MATQAKRTKRRKPKPKPPKRSKESFFRRKKTATEKAFMVAGIIIAISMVLSLFVSFGSTGF